jgi:hypothetical protein
LQKPAPIKDFCNILFFVNALPLGLACEFFCARHARSTRAEPDSRVKNFFSQAVPGSACEGRFKFGFDRIGTTLIRLRETPDRVCMPCRHLEAGLARRFCRARSPQMPRQRPMQVRIFIAALLRAPLIDDGRPS